MERRIIKNDLQLITVHVNKCLCIINVQGIALAEEVHREDGNHARILMKKGWIESPCMLSDNDWVVDETLKEVSELLDESNKSLTAVSRQGW